MYLETTSSQSLNTVHVLPTLKLRNCFSLLVCTTVHTPLCQVSNSPRGDPSYGDTEGVTTETYRTETPHSPLEK